MPAWAEGLTVRLDAEPAKSKPSRDEVRTKKLAHAQRMRERAERRAKLAATVLKRWKRRELAAENAIARAASKERAS